MTNVSTGLQTPGRDTHVKGMIAERGDKLVGSFTVDDPQNGEAYVAERLTLPPGASKPEIMRLVGDYLDRTVVFGRKYADEFLTQKGFIDKARNFVNAQSDPDDKPYAVPILESMERAAKQYASAPAAPAPIAQVTLAPGPSNG